MGFLIITNCVVTLASMVILRAYFIKEDEVVFLKKKINEKNKTIEDLQLELKDLKYIHLCEGVSSK